DDARAAAGQLVAQADLALAARRLDEALRLYTQAGRLLPGDEAAALGLQKVNAALAALPAAQAASVRAMSLGAAGLQARPLAGAAAAFAEALRLVPGDPQASQGLRDARAGVRRQAARRLDFDRLMQAGAAAYKQQQYAAAVRAYREALRLIPDDPDA